MGMLKISDNVVNCGKSRTQQSFMDECNINKIIRKIEKGHMINHINSKQGLFMDVSNVVDYHTAVNIVENSKKMFMSLSAEVRGRFDNDPGKLINFLTNENNKEEAIKLGLIKKEVKENGDVHPGVEGDGNRGSGNSSGAGSQSGGEKVK